MKRIILLTLTVCVALSAPAFIALPPLFAAARDTATATDATPTDGQPIDSFWDTVPGNGPVFPTAPTPLAGDLDGSGTLEPADARLALRYAVGLEPLLEAQNALYLVDRDGDGKATPADARLILRASVGLDGFRLPDPEWDVYRIRAYGVDFEYGELGALKALEVNAEPVTDTFGEDLPLWRVDSRETLEQWIGAFRRAEHEQQLKISDHELLPEPADAAVLAFLKRYDKDFFAENDLLICYKYEGSGGFLQAVYRPAVQEGTLTLTVCTAYQPEYGYTADIGCWFIFVPVSKTLTAQCRSFACREGDVVLLEERPDVATEGAIYNWAYCYRLILTEDAEITTNIGDNPCVFTLKNRQDGGYLWTCDEAEGLSVQEQIVEYPDRSAVGADSLQVYSVTGDKPGAYTLRFRLKRPWETDSIAERTVTVVVR